MTIGKIVLTIRDAGGDVSPVSVHFDAGDGDTVTTLGEDYAHIFWDSIRPLVNGVLVGVVVSVGVDFGEWDNNVATVISDVEEKVLFHFRVCGIGRSIRMTLPTVKESIFTGSGAEKLVDITNSDYAYFDYVMVNGVVDGGIGATDRHGNDLCQVLLGEQLFGR